MASTFIIYFIIQLILFISYSFECGIIVHNEVSYRSLQLFRPLNEVEHKYKDLLSSLPSFLQAGSYFPDWGYNCLGYHEQSEDVHWAPFIKTAINYLRDTYPQPWTDYHVKGLVVFIFSIMSHDIADVKWHSLNHLENYFIQAMAQLDFDGDFQLAHTVADTGAEFVLRHSTNLDYLNQKWQIPLNDIIEIYTRYYHSIDNPQPIPEKNHIRYCMTGAFASVKLDLSVGKHMYSTFGSTSPFLVDQLNDYHKGGLQDLSASVSHCYRDIIKSIENGVINTLCGNYFDDQENKDIYNKIKQRHFNHKIDTLYNNTIVITNEDELKNVEQKYGITSEWNEMDGVLTLTMKESLKSYMLFNNNNNNQLINDDLKLSENNNYFSSSLQQPLKLSESNQCSSWRQNENDISSFSLPSSLTGFGHVTVSGDFNNDGKTDIAISAPYYTDEDNDKNDEPSLMTGAVFVLNGDQSIWQQQRIDIRNFSSTILKGTDDFGRFGTAMAVADMNRDGIDDLIVSSPFANNLIGSINIYFGSTNGLPNKPDIQFTSSHEHGIEGFGYTLFSIDIDQDGYKDLLVGCPYCKVDDKSQAGFLEIYTSKYFNTETRLNNQEHWTIFSNTPSSFERFGTSISFTSSVLNEHAETISNSHAEDNDTIFTLVVGAPGAKINNLSQAGKVYGFDVKNIMFPTLKWFINGTKKFGQFGSVIQSWKNDILVISSPTEDTFNILKKHWQGGSVRIYNWKTLNRGNDELINNYGLIGNLQGQTSSGHFGSSIAFFMNNENVGLWIGEPLGYNENGRLYKWTLRNNDLECLANNINMARFGSQVTNIEPNVICITSLYNGQNTRSSGIIHFYRS